LNRIWRESKKRLPEYMEEASHAAPQAYALNLDGWAKRYLEDGAKTIPLEELRRLFGLESVKDAE
jgi:hypothetical protein